MSLTLLTTMFSLLASGTFREEDSRWEGLKKAVLFLCFLLPF